MSLYEEKKPRRIRLVSSNELPVHADSKQIADESPQKFLQDFLNDTEQKFCFPDTDKK